MESFNNFKESRSSYFLVLNSMILLFIVLHSSISFAQSIITAVAGNTQIGGGYNGDKGPATSIRLANPTSVALDASGNLYIADWDFHVIRKVNSAGMLTTIAGNAHSRGNNGDSILATETELNYPNGVICDASGNLYIADLGNNRIRKVDASGIIVTIAGVNGPGFGGDGGLATAAIFNNPICIIFDLVGNLYIVDAGNNVIRKVNKAGIISTVAGDGTQGEGYSGDNGPATSAQLSTPLGMACDANGNLYIADDGNNVIRKVDTKGIITTFAGHKTKGFGYSGDNGLAINAQLNHPYGVVCDTSGNLFISDAKNNVIRKVDKAGIITTVVGNVATSGGCDGNKGPATAAHLGNPYGLAFDASGNLFIADQSCGEIRKVTGLSGVKK